jgi:hypothetical protein
MTTLEQETGIIERLQEKIPKVAVEGFADISHERQLDRIKTEFAATRSMPTLLVVYRGSEFGKPEPTDVVVQDETVMFEILVVGKNLRKHGDMYNWLNAVRLSLIGYRMPGCKKMYAVDAGLVQEEDGTWYYRITFAFHAPVVELDDEETEILLKRIMTEDNLGETTETP